MKTILIPVSQDAPFEKLKKAIHMLANKTIYKLHLVHVLTSISTKEYIEAIEKGEKNTVTTLKEKEAEAMIQFGEGLKADGYAVETTSALGLFHQKFATMVNEINPSFVMMITSGSDNLLEDLFGTNTFYILNNIQAPLFVIPDDFELRQFKMAMIGLDLKKNGLSALKDIFSFTDEAGIDTTFVKIDNNLQADMVDDESILTELQKLYPGRIDHIIHRKHESIAEGLENFADESGSDLIILFTSKRNFIKELFHKSVTQELTLYSKKPLLIYHY